MNSNSMPNFTCVTNQSFECAITHKLLMKSTSRFILSNLSHPISKDITITIYKKHDSKDDIGEQLYQYNSQANIFSNSVHINVTFKESSLSFTKEGKEEAHFYVVFTLNLVNCLKATVVSGIFFVYKNGTQKTNLEQLFRIRNEIISISQMSDIYIQTPPDQFYENSIDSYSDLSITSY